MSGSVARSLAAVKRERAAAQSQSKAPARARVGARKISDTKAARIVARVDARRPASQTASSSARRNQNALRTYQRATEFLLSPSRRALKRGSQISTNESVRRAVANAKPKSAKPAASPRASTGRSRKQAAATPEAGSLRASAARIDKNAQRDFNGLAINVTNKMRARADKLDAIASADSANRAAAAADRKKRAKIAGSTGTRRDANRLRTLNNRLRYFERSGYTPDDLSVVATKSARNALAASMVGRGGQRVSVRTKAEASKAQRARTRNMIDAGNARAKLHQSDGGVTIRMQNGYGVRKAVEKRSRPRLFGNPYEYYADSAKQPGKAVRVEVRPGGGRRVKAVSVGTQKDLFGGGKSLKVYRPTASRRSRRR